MRLTARTLPLALFIVAATSLVGPVTAVAAVDVTSDGAGGLRVTATDAAENVTIERSTAGLLRVRETTTSTTSSDASCTADLELTTAVACTVTSGAPVTVLLGAGNDTLDARTATGVAIVVNGQAGADTLRVGASGTTRVTDATATDTIDMSHADGGVRVRYERAALRLVARCGECSTPWAVNLPIAPSRVLLGDSGDDVELNAWRTFGRTTWILGEEKDRFFGSPVHRSVVDAGADRDTLVSRAAADVLRGGAGYDKLGDFGGTGDVLSGGADTDTMASLDARRDTLTGGEGRDLCMSRNRSTSGCDSGSVNVDLAMYTPITTQAVIMQALGID